MTGCTLKAHDTFGSNGSGSDFYLVQIKAAIPSNYNAYYNGWSRSTTASTSGVGIHHPDGDIKKISTYTTALYSVSVGGTGSHWEVSWAGTANGHGVTEPGSSGSPIFNSTGQIIGTLTSGYSACNALTDPDQYGKFSLHWSSNGTTSAKQLKPWLDPLNINPTSINGTYTCVSGIAKDQSTDDGIQCYPNPAVGSVKIDFGGPLNSSATVALFDLFGRQVRNEFLEKQSVSIATLDLSGLNGGIYYLNITMNDRSMTRKIILLDQ